MATVASVLKQTPAYEVITVAPTATDAERMAACGTDLSRYPGVLERNTFPALPVSKDRSLFAPLVRSYLGKALGRVSNPSMLTHIVTTRCNYSCGFCSFADTLNVKTNELTLEEIRKTYASIGSSLNTIVYSGGETTLNKDLAAIIESAYVLTPVKSVYIISNAWKPDVLFHLTHRIKQTCPDLHLTWSLSIEGPREINNKTRYTQKADWDAWQNTIDTLWGLKALREAFYYKELDVQLCTVCSPGNYHAMADWYAMVKNVLLPDKWNLNLMRKSVQMSQNELSSWQERRAGGKLEPFEKTYFEITEQVRQDVLSGQLKFLYHTGNGVEGAMKSAIDLISQEDNRRVILGEPPAICCRAANQGAYIGSDGEVSGCEEFANNPADNKSFGNLKEVDGDFQALWHSEKASRYRALVGKAEECYGCTLESQKNYPSVLVSFKHLLAAGNLARSIR